MFSKLERDQKTLNIIYDILGHFFSPTMKRDLISLNAQLIGREIREHLSRNGFDENDLFERNNWIGANGAPYREYINACTMIAVIVEADVKRGYVKIEDINNEFLNNLIEVFDIDLFEVADTIFKKSRGLQTIEGLDESI